MNNYVSSLIRTWVPVWVSAALAWLSAETGLIVDENTAAQGVLFFNAVLTGLYYALIRWLEQRYPQVGWLLGLAKQPGYSPEEPPPPQPPPAGSDTGAVAGRTIAVLLFAAAAVFALLAVLKVGDPGDPWVAWSLLGIASGLVADRI